MTSIRRVSDEVFFADGPVVVVSGTDIARLKETARGTPRQRTRLCTHRSVDDPIHEMLIVHGQKAYVRPHRHPGKTEAFHLIEGRVDVVLFDDAGVPRRAIRLGAYASGLPFYYRLAEPRFHMVIIRSEAAVFHEVTNGPFRPSDTEFAPWAPPEQDAEAVRTYVERLERSLEGLTSHDASVP